MLNNHMSPQPSDSGEAAGGEPPAVAIHGRGWHVRIDVLPRLSRGLLIKAVVLVCSITSVWGMLASLAR